MSFSPALAHRQRVLASLATGTAAVAGGAPPMPEDGPVASEYQQLLMALGQDLRRLGDIQSVEKKIEAKRGMIAAYLPWITGALEGKAGVQDEIVSTMLVWSIDIADWDLALGLAAYVLRHKIALPERYKRQPATLIAEEVAEAGLAVTPAVDLATLQAVSALTHDQDMHDQVRAKLTKAIGLALKAKAEAFEGEADSAVAGGKPALVAAALTHFRRALELDPKCGVKKLIEGLERELKKLGEEAT
jgi:hypothetical protein